MKTAISIDTAIYQKAERTAAELGVSRSRLYALAIEEYLRNHRGDAITERLNQYYLGNHKDSSDDDVRQAAYTLLAREDW